jgi:peptidoglycan/LPS O-acetylase OafA/YrhL
MRRIYRATPAVASGPGNPAGAVPDLIDPFFPARPGHYRVRVAAPSRLPSLTGLRFVAAFLVFGFHVGVVGLVDTGAAGTATSFLFAQGAVGVSFFFILSGFVLTWSARTDDTVRRFWQRRFAKIYPNHLVTWVPALAVALVTGTGVTLTIALTNLLLVQAWIPDPRIYYGLNSVSWSLACEFFFYLLFPLLRRGLVRLSGRALWPAAIGALAVVWLIPLAVQPIPDRYHYWAIWLFPVARLPEFVAGMVLARIVQEGRWIPFGVLPASLFAVVSYLASAWLPDDLRIVAGTAVPLALLIAAVGAADAAGRPTPWRSRWAVWLGEVSYAFYLVHLLVLRLFAKAVGTSHSAIVEIGLVLVALAVAVLGSWLLYICVERPGMRLLGPRRKERGTIPQQRPVSMSDSRRVSMSDSRLGNG